YLGIRCQPGALELNRDCLDGRERRQLTVRGGRICKHRHRLYPRLYEAVEYNPRLGHQCGIPGAQIATGRDLTFPVSTAGPRAVATSSAEILRPQLNVLTSLRFFAAALVVLFH